MQRGARAIANLAKRASKLSEIEAAKAPEDRLINRLDSEAEIRVLLSARFQKRADTVKEWFKELLLNPQNRGRSWSLLSPQWHTFYRQDLSNVT